MAFCEKADFLNNGLSLQFYTFEIFKQRGIWCNIGKENRIKRNLKIEWDRIEVCMIAGKWEKNEST